MAQFLITLTQANEFPQRSLKVLLYKESTMDPVTQTILTLVLMFIANLIGKKIGRNEGINAAVTYMIDMGACTENDLVKANEKFIDEMSEEDDH